MRVHVSALHDAKEGRQGSSQLAAGALGSDRPSCHQQTVTHLRELDEAGRLRARALARALVGEPEQADLLNDGTGDQTIGVRLKGVRVENGRHFGHMYLALALWRACRLDEFAGTHIAPPARKG